MTLDEATEMATGTTALPLRVQIYVNGVSGRNQALLARIRRMLEDHPAASRCEVVDIQQDRESVLRDNIIALPTIVRLEPQPELRLIGMVGDDDFRAILEGSDFSSAAMRDQSHPTQADQ